MLLNKRTMRVPAVSQFSTGERVIYQPSSKHEPTEATYIMRKGNNTSWLYRKDSAVLASDSQIAPLPVKIELESENEDDHQREIANNNAMQPTTSDELHGQELTAKAEPPARPKRSQKAVIKYQAGFS